MDTTLKVFHLNSIKMNLEYNFKFDRTLNEVKNLFQINYLWFGTWSDDSP